MRSISINHPSPHSLTYSLSDLRYPQDGRSLMLRGTYSGFCFMPNFYSHAPLHPFAPRPTFRPLRALAIELILNFVFTNLLRKEMRTIYAQ